MEQLEEREICEIFKASVFQFLLENRAKLIGKDEVEKCLIALNLNWDAGKDHLSLDHESGKYRLNSYQDMVGLSKNVLEWQKNRADYSLSIAALIAIIKQGIRGDATPLSFVNHDFRRNIQIAHMVAIGSAQIISSGIRLCKIPGYSQYLEKEIDELSSQERLNIQDAIS
jgi:hypothetical protein